MSIMSVSYTHLDYYSLQQLQTQETFGASQKVDLYVRAVGSGAVSYTHLDVYKRQKLRNIESVIDIERTTG